MNLVHFSQTNWVWFSFLNLKSKMKIKGLLNVIPGIFNHVHMLLFIFFNSPFLDCKGITQPFQHMTYGLWFFFFFFGQISLSIAKSGWKLFWNRMFFLESLELYSSVRSCWRNMSAVTIFWAIQEIAMCNVGSWSPWFLGATQKQNLLCV